MTQFDEMMRTADHVRRMEQQSVKNGLTEALRLLRNPTDRPDLDKQEIQSRIVRASDFLGRLP